MNAPAEAWRLSSPRDMRHATSRLGTGNLAHPAKKLRFARHCSWFVLSRVAAGIPDYY